MPNTPVNTFNAQTELKVGSKSYQIMSLQKASDKLGDISRLPKSLKILLENLLRWENGVTVKKEHIQALVDWQKNKSSQTDIAYHPARVLMQDFTGVPAVVDLAAMRDAMQNLGADPLKINPLTPVDLVIDHSVQVDEYASAVAFQHNVDLEMQRNQERYRFLRWGQQAFKNFRVVPPGTGICHQVNLEYLAQVVWTKQENSATWAYPDTLVGTDSHTTMVNGLAVLGWGVGGIEAEAAMLGQAVTMLIPEVIGFKLTGALKEGTTATDLVLTVTQMLRKKGVVGKFVEFYGEGLESLTLADRATIANMAPEYGATCGFFPIDSETLNYLSFTGRSSEQVALVKAYAEHQGLFRHAKDPEPLFTDSLELNLSSVEPSLAGPKRPQDRVLLSQAAEQFRLLVPQMNGSEAASDMLEEGGNLPPAPRSTAVQVKDKNFTLNHGSVVIAAITSCTNTSNPAVMLAAGLVAKKAAEKGLQTKPWVKTSLAPGSQVVTDYLEKAGVQKYLDQLGFNLVGYGCTTCIGNSGPLNTEIADAVHAGDLTVCSVLSGNRNFEGRISPQCKANYLASPPLVVAYALLGCMHKDITTVSLGKDKNGNDVFLKDIWPSNAEIQQTLQASVNSEMFTKRYANVFEGPTAWKEVASPTGMTYTWDTKSTYIQNPPYFVGFGKTPKSVNDIQGAKILALLGDSVTTDHISPAGAIKDASPAGLFLQQHGVKPVDFNSYGSRRGNHEVMMRGTFANIRIRNEMNPEKEGGFTKLPDGSITSIYDAAMEYAKTATPLVIFAGKEYGTGSSRDWAAKGTNLLGVKAVIAESFERIHRSNLIGMGVLPLQFQNGETRKSWNLDGSETIAITGFASNLKAGMQLECTITKKDGTQKKQLLLCRVDTPDEVEFFKNGGILQYVLRQLAN